MAIEINDFLAYLNKGNHRDNFAMFLEYLADDKNYSTINKDDEGLIIVDERIYITFNEKLRNKHFSFTDIVFNQEVTFQSNFDEGLEFYFENVTFKKINILDCTTDSILFSGETNKTEELNICGSVIKAITINADIQGNVNFKKCKFGDFNLYNAGKNISFMGDFVFEFCETEKISNFMNFNFKNKASFKMSKFKDNVYFNNSHFCEYADFHECDFEKVACFYGVDFKKTPNFSQAIFKGNLNLVNAKLNFDFEDLNKRINQEYNAYENQKTRKEAGVIPNLYKEKPLESFANDFRDSFRIFKNALIKDNNLLDASNFHRVELYCKEMELENKQPQKFSKDWIDKWVLVFYRILCDHHTNLIPNLKWLVWLIALYSILLGKVCMVYPIALLGILIYVFGCKKWIFISQTTSVVIILCVIFQEPKIIFGIAGLFTSDLNWWQNFITAAYTILMALVLFSLQKTARKNSIVPS